MNSGNGISTATGPGLSRAGDAERLEDGPGNLRLVADGDHRLDDRAEQGLVGQPVHLADGRPGRPVDVRDDADDRERCRTGPRRCRSCALVSPGPGTTAKTPTSPVARAAASAMTLAEASWATRKYGCP